MGLFPELFQNTKDLDLNFVQPGVQTLTLPFPVFSGQSGGGLLEVYGRWAPTETVVQSHLHGYWCGLPSPTERAASRKAGGACVCQETEVCWAGGV